MQNAVYTIVYTAFLKKLEKIWKIKGFLDRR